MSYASLDELRSHLGGEPVITPEYRAKMLHPVPVTTEVKREAFILQHCTGKRVLEFGASGPLHEEMMRVSGQCMGVDRQGSDHILGMDLDDVSLSLPSVSADLIVCGEVLEHLSNPGWFLTRLKRQYAGVPVIITVPNGFAETGRKWILKGIENVNLDHVSWYSPQTLSVLLQRAGYTVGELFWYGGHGPTAEGLLVVTE